MHTLSRYCIYLSLLISASPAGAQLNIAGIQLADHYSLAGQSLTLNGGGIRSKFFMKIYVGALYLGQTTHDPQQALRSPGPKSMQMMMLYKEVAAGKIAEGWNDGFEANLSAADLARLKARLQQFNELFPTLRKGDRAVMNFVPGQGTTLTVNDDVKGQIPGDDFFAALLSVWIGQHPADGQLKDGLMGN